MAGHQEHRRQLDDEMSRTAGQKHGRKKKKFIMEDQNVSGEEDFPVTPRHGFQAEMFEAEISGPPAAAALTDSSLNNDAVPAELRPIIGANTFDQVKQQLKQAATDEVPSSTPPHSNAGSSFQSPEMDEPHQSQPDLRPPPPPPPPPPVHQPPAVVHHPPPSGTGNQGSPGSFGPGPPRFPQDQVPFGPMSNRTGPPDQYGPGPQRHGPLDQFGPGPPRHHSPSDQFGPGPHRHGPSDQFGSGPPRPGPPDQYGPQPNRSGPPGPGPYGPGPNRLGPPGTGPYGPGPNRPGPPGSGPFGPGLNHPGPPPPGMGPFGPGPNRPGPFGPGPNRPGPQGPGSFNPQMGPRSNVGPYSPHPPNHGFMGPRGRNFSPGMTPPPGFIPPQVNRSTNNGPMMMGPTQQGRPRPPSFLPPPPPPPGYMSGNQRMQHSTGGSSIRSSNATTISKPPAIISSAPMLYTAQSKENNKDDIQSKKIPSVAQTEIIKGPETKKRKKGTEDRKAEIPNAAEVSLALEMAERVKQSTITVKHAVNTNPQPHYNQQPHSEEKKKERKSKKNLRYAGGQVWEDHCLAEWDSDDFRLFVGDLGNDVTDDLLHRQFCHYSSFQKAKVIRDKRTNKSKGYGFISFNDPQDYIRAMKEMNGKYLGSRPIKLRKSTWRDRNLDIVQKKLKEKQVAGLK